MNQRKLTIMLLISMMLFISGCFSDKGVQSKYLKAGVAKQDTKLLSYYEDEVLYTYYSTDKKPRKSNGIRITKEGFYPNCKIADTILTSELKGKMCIYNKYMKEDKYFPMRRFNMTKFMNDVNSNKLKELREKLLIIHKKYPELKPTKVCSRWTITNAELLSLKEIDRLASYNLPAIEAKKILDKLKETRSKQIKKKVCGVCPCNEHPSCSCREPEAKKPSYSSQGSNSSGSYIEQPAPRQKTFSERYYRPGIGHVYDDGTHMGF